MPEAIRSRIFEPFYTSKPVGMGTGIGLSFSYGVIASHGGQISLEPVETGGARFVISLPLAVSAASADLSLIHIWITAIVTVATVISYFHVKHNLQTQTLEQLQRYVQEWGARESAIFVLAQDNLRTFAQDYAKRLENFDGIDPQTRFGELFAEREDGSTRLRDFFFEKSDITGVIGKYVNFDAELRRRLVIGYDLLAQYGPAWRQRFVNLYITTPEHGILIYWPGKPWGLSLIHI